MTASTLSSSKRSRSPPFPNSILDRQALLKALEDRTIFLKPMQFDLFYQNLHRQHYPELPVFVENYYKHELKLNVDDDILSPLKNKVSKTKNRNRKQLNGQFLDFLKDPNNGFTTITSTIHIAKQSSDQTTTKLAIQLHDGHKVESVLMRYNTVAGSRVSLCVSSQVGCAMGCTFCATATMGMRGNLTSGEILEQMVHAHRYLANEWKVRTENEEKEFIVRNVVFMGMGEPLNNYNNVVEACRCMLDRKRWNLAHGKITVSTVGVTPRIYDLTRDLPEVSLALSLHAPNQEARSAIVPAAKAYKIEGLIDALDNHMMFYQRNRYNGEEFTDADRVKESNKRRAMIEYVMLEGTTSSLECAHQLGKLCENRHLLVNLIPYNPTDVKDTLKCPSEEHMKEFQTIVSSYNTLCTIRRTMGADIASACGQLVVTDIKQVDIEDVTKPRKNEIGNSSVVTRKSTAMKARTRSVETSTEDKNDASDQSDDMDRWIKPLMFATSVAAACFAVSSVCFFMRIRGARSTR